MNRNLFNTTPRAPAPDTINEAGGLAYARSPKEALEQYALTGCFNNTFYISGGDQLTKVLDLCNKVNDPAWIAQLAIRARVEGMMKDMPVFLLAYVATKDSALFRASFAQCVDNVKQLSKFVRILRSGVLGRKSLSRSIATTIEQWLDSRTDENLWWQSVGVADPSLGDILRLAHPKPKTPARAALYGYISGRNSEEHAIDRSMLPEKLKSWIAWDGTSRPMPKVPFQLLVGREGVDWNDIADNSTWAQARQSLNTFNRHGCFKDGNLVARLASKLSDPPRVFPYQILTTYQNIEEGTPRQIVDALHDAMEKACANVPALPGEVLIAVDVSSSMRSPVTGQRDGSTSKTKCIDVASLIACSILRTTPSATVVAFDLSLYGTNLEPRDSVMTNAKRLARYGGGGTNCELPLAWALQTGKAYDLIVYVSDNESWGGNQAGMAQAWAQYSRLHKKTKMICIDLTPNPSTQVRSSERVWNIGGFSDAVFEVAGRIAGVTKTATETSDDEVT